MSAFTRRTTREATRTTTGMNAFTGMWLVARRELAAYFDTFWGWAVVAGLLLVDGLLFNAFALGAGPRLSGAVLESFFEFSSGVTMVAGVLLTIRLFAEERQSGTLVLLEGAPIPEWSVVGGKFLSAFAFLALLIVLTAYLPLLILVNGKVSLGHVLAGYLGLFLLGAAVTAIGAFGSSLTRSQVVAGVVGGLLVVVLLLLWLLARITAPPFSDVFQYMALWDRQFRPFMQGRIESEAIVYYLSLTAVFLMLTTRVTAWRRRR